MSNLPVKKDRPAKPNEIIGEDVEKEVVVSKRKVSNPQLNFGEENVKPGDNARYLRHAMVSLSLPPIDISDPAQVEQRINDYFIYCVNNDRKPNIKGLGNWIGVSRETVNTWKNGDYRAATHSDLIKKAIDVLEELWVDYMQNGKVNPASGIFLGKNMFGYKDVQDHVITPNNPLGTNADPATMAQKYQAALPDASDFDAKEDE